jgi:hypothetical protein
MHGTEIEWLPVSKEVQESEVIEQDVDFCALGL